LVEDFFKNKQGQRFDLGKLGTSKKGHVTLNLLSLLKLFSLVCRRIVPDLVKTPHNGSHGSPESATPVFLTIATVVFVLSILCVKAMAQGDSLSKIRLMPQKDSLSKMSGIAPKDSLAGNSGITQETAPLKNSVDEDSGYTKIDLTDKKIRVYGWGEYRVGGHCLCCDNIRDGDCITVSTVNRTDRIRIKQIVDEKIEADTSDKTTYFGDVMERDRPDAPVNLLIAEITLKNLQDLYKVIVYTMVDKEKKKSFLSTCELGYTDQFDRLQWVGKVENKKSDDRITFTMEKPVFTKNILLKIKDGRSRITEVALFTRNNKK
jgi:hypothetical protein